MDAAEYLQREIARVGALVAAIGEERSRGAAPGPWASTIRAARAARARSHDYRSPAAREAYKQRAATAAATPAP